MYGRDLTIDDAITQQAMLCDHRLEAEHRGQVDPPEDQVMFQLVRAGLYDLPGVNPNTILSRVYRYSAVTADRLWVMLRQERARVRSSSLSGLTEIDGERF